VDRAYTAALLPSDYLFVAGMSQGTWNEDHAAATYPLSPVIGTPAVRTTSYYPQNNTANSDFATSSVVVGSDAVTAGVAYTVDKSSNFIGNFAITWWNATGAYRKVETVFAPDKKGVATTKSKAVKILVAPDGSLVAFGEDNPGSRFAFARYDSATGALLTKRLHNIAFQPRGGAIKGNSVFAVGKLLTTNEMAIVKTNLNGVLDQTWGTGGILAIPIGSDSQAEAASIDADGRIVVAGWAVFGEREAVLVRVKANGNLDRTFNGTGLVRGDFGGTESLFTAINLRENGLIVATGHTSTFDAGRQYGKIVAAQFLADGSIDSANFGENGSSILTIRDSALCFDSKIQADGRLVLVGEVRTRSETSPVTYGYDIIAVQLDLNGRP